MRILWTSTPMEGVFLPFVPVAGALQDREHELLVAAGPDIAARVAEAGFEQRVIGPSAMEAAKRAFADPAVAAADGAGTAFGAAMFGSVFAPALLPEIRRMAEEFHPAVIVHPEVETSGAIVAAQRGVPSVTYGFAQPIKPAMVRDLAERVATLWTSAGLSADGHAGIYRDLYLDPCPPTLRLGDRAAPCPVQLVRPETAGRLGGILPERIARLGARPVVYVSLGTVPLFSRMQTFSVLVSELSRADVDIVVTVGPHNDPAQLADQPPNVYVERWLPLAPLLDVADAVVCHGGSGTTLAALGAGRPLVLVPQGADQFENAAACDRAGAAVVLTPNEVDAPSVRRAVKTVLTPDSPQRNAALRIASEIATMPDARAAAETIEQLVQDRSQ
ncbi:MAG TPA: glycosyltransferase [Acidimicrobiia bacterium]|nr:glycosyltransferase [Acidimicrobiia bacterium]